MTATTQEAPQASAPAREGTSQAFRRPSRDEVVNRIAAEARDARVPCGPEKAERLIDVLEIALGQLRAHGGVYHVTTEQLDDVHAVMDVVIPDDRVVPPADSAQESINLLLLEPGEVALVHTKAGGRNEYCAVELRVE